MSYYYGGYYQYHSLANMIPFNNARIVYYPYGHPDSAPPISYHVVSGADLNGPALWEAGPNTFYRLDDQQPEPPMPDPSWAELSKAESAKLPKTRVATGTRGQTKTNAQYADQVHEDGSSTEAEVKKSKKSKKATVEEVPDEHFEKFGAGRSTSG